MSSTGIINGVYNNLEADIIDVNDSLFVNKINVIDFINDLSENLVDLSENVYDKIDDISGNINDQISNIINNIFDLSGNIINNIFDLSGNINNQITNIINDIFDLSGNINNNINDLSGNLSGLNNTVTDLSQNVQGIKATNTLQDLKLIAHGAEISANTDALVTLGGIVTTNVAATGANTVLINGILLSLGIPSTVLTPGTGIYGSIDSKTSRSLFGSGNVAIYGIGPLEYINLVYNNDHFEDIKLISNHALNLKEPYKSLPNALNNLTNIVNTKQDNLYFTSPLLKDVSNNITIDLSSYVLNTKFDLSLNDLQNKKQDNLLFTSPLLKDVSNNITIDLSSYVLNTKFDLSLNDLQNKKQDNLLFTSPLLKDVSNNITIDLSSYVLKTNFDSSLNNIISTKQNNFTCISPLIKNDVSNNITIDLSSYVLKTNLDSSLNTINYTLSNKQNIFTCISPLIKNDISNNITIDLSAYPLKSNVDSSLNNIISTKQDNINVTSPLIKTSNNISIDLSAYALKNSLNASNVTAGTLPVSFGGTGSTTLSSGQILIGNGTNPLLQSSNLIWDSSNNGLGIGTTQFFDTSTNLQVNNRRLWINSTPNNSISVLSTDKYGTGTTESYIKLTENGDIDYRVPSLRYHNFKCADKTPLFIDKDSITVENMFVTDSALVKNMNIWQKATIQTLQVNNDIIADKFFSSNATSKNLIKFQTKLGTNGLYYYNLEISKYYKTGQNINGKDYKIFNLTSWSEDAFTIINKCTVYISSEGSGIKYIMFYDNWGAYLSNGNQSGWQRDSSITYMTFMTSTSKNIITILENLL